MSLSNYSPVRASIPELKLKIVKFVGGTAAVTKLRGEGVTVTYISTGVVDLEFGTGDGPIGFVGLCGFGFEATVQSGVKGYTVAAGVFNTSTGKLRLNITSAGDALVDLAALQWLTLTLGIGGPPA